MQDFQEPILKLQDTLDIGGHKGRVVEITTSEVGILLEGRGKQTFMIPHSTIEKAVSEQHT